MAREECKNDQRILLQPARNAQKAASGPSTTATTNKRGSQAFLHEIIGKYNLIKDDYHKSAIGAKDEIEAVFLSLTQ